MSTIKITCHGCGDDVYVSPDRALLNVGVRTPEADDIQASIDAHGDAVTWLDSAAFDTDRAALRLTGGA